MNDSVLVTLPAPAPPVDQLWDVLLDLDASRLRWTLIGGQMVLLHALEHGHMPPVISLDRPSVATRQGRRTSATTSPLVRRHGLRGGGDHCGRLYSPLHPHRDAAPGRHRRPRPRRARPADQLTTTPPGRTIEVPVGTQALERTQVVRVRHGRRTGTVPRPSLIAAIVGKAAACAHPGDPARHERDLALLCALIPDPFAMRAQMTPKDLKRLRGAAGLTHPQAAAWDLVPTTMRPKGVTAHAILAG